MSSGVDSSVAASIYAKKYRNVRGIFMANWSQTAKCTERDWNDVQKVCEKLGIPCERVNFEHEYWQDVFAPMIEQYESGLTPNPDVNCNKFVKFGKLIDHVREKFSSSPTTKWWLVTGHYARVMLHKPSNEYHLLRGYSANKDQSYYLSSINPKVLKHILMPIGHHIKPEVRKLANALDLHVSEKPDSQGLCFVSQDHKKFRDFLEEYIKPKPGNIVTEDGKVWGRHSGLWYATIGQKSSISMPQGDEKYKGVWFVSEKNKERNELIIVKGSDNPKLFSNRVKVVKFEWMVPHSEDEISDDLKGELSSGKLSFQHRSLQKAVPLVGIQQVGVSSGSTTNACTYTYIFTFKDSVRALAQGQYFVLYRDNQVLGSGIIESTFCK
ncbi:tRNA-specific 2-thiouridylase [Scheffersomyces amazonensis]|uniref:tRNA-specific 2-thiouridylase n=1 Tax=Scheffersomyces amazonensis TaxID=1078765 RepID=UPI00315C6130